MYCKYCGKQIADDSTFCQYGGGKLDERTNNGEQSHIEEPVDPKAETNTPAQEVVVTTKEAKPIQVEVSKKSTDNRSTIANEIVGNLKMVGVAFLLFAIHMTVFFMKHQKDIKEYDYPNSSYFGESCYDPSSLSGNWKFNWEEHYYDQLYYNYYNQVDFSFENPSPKQCLEQAEALEKRLKYSEEEIKFWRDQAKKDAKRDKQDWNDTINNQRKWGYQEDLKKNATYASIICLLLMVLGRYLVKLVKWVSTNKTE